MYPSSILLSFLLLQVTLPTNSYQQKVTNKQLPTKKLPTKSYQQKVTISNQNMSTIYVVICYIKRVLWHWFLNIYVGNCPSVYLCTCNATNVGLHQRRYCRYHKILSKSNKNHFSGKRKEGCHLCAYHPAAQGSSPMHTIYDFIIYGQMCAIFVMWKERK